MSGYLWNRSPKKPPTADNDLQKPDRPLTPIAESTELPEKSDEPDDKEREERFESDFEPIDRQETSSMDNIQTALLAEAASETITTADKETNIPECKSDLSDDDSEFEDDQDKSLTEEEIENEDMKRYVLSRNEEEDLYVISINSYPRFYANTEDEAKKILWAMTRRVVKNMQNDSCFQLSIHPEAENILEIYGAHKFLMVSYDQLLHKFSYTRARRASMK